MLISIYFPPGLRQFRKVRPGRHGRVGIPRRCRMTSHVPLDPCLRYAMGVRTVVIERK